MLIIEDDVHLVDMYRQFLEDRFDVRTATSGAEGLETVNGGVDVVLLDRRMPGMSGDEVLVEMRSRGLDCPVAMVTAVEPDTDIIDLGVDDYLTKPVSKAELADLVDTLVRRLQYDGPTREHLSIASKVAALQTNHSREQLAAHGEYLELVDRLRASRGGTDSLLQEGDGELDELLRDTALPRFRRGRNED